MMDITESEIRLMMKVAFDQGVHSMKVINKIKDPIERKEKYRELIDNKESFFDRIISNLPVIKTIVRKNRNDLNL